MKLRIRKDLHQLFRIGVILKAIDGSFEIVAGMMLYFVRYAQFRLFFHTLFYDEITESPHDLYWDYITRIWHYFSDNTKFLWAFVLIAHGITKLFLAIMLLKNKLWAYPVAAVVFSLFAIYQIYTLNLQFSWFLALFTIYDIIVIFLIIREYRYVRHLNNK